MEAAAAEGGFVCGRLRPESAAMAGVLSRDAPDIEVPTAALGWEGHRGAGGPGTQHTPDRAGDPRSFLGVRLAGQAEHCALEQDLVTS